MHCRFSLGDDSKVFPAADVLTGKIQAGNNVVVGSGLVGCENALYDQLKDQVANIWRIGDARNVANIMYAIWDAYEVASQLE
jgi:2-enoate reductase